MNVADTDNGGHSEPPLLSIGLAVFLILSAPIVLYSLAPTGPLRKGDTIFADGPQRVPVSRKAESAEGRQQDSCLLDEGNALIILEPPAERADGMLLAQVQGNQTVEWPFCLPHAEVLLNSHQTYQKPGLLRVVQGNLTRLFRP